MEYKPYPYQQKVIDEVLEKFDDGKRKLLVQGSTGFGKTVVFSNLTKHYTDKNKKVLVLCHRIELVQQTIKTMEAIGLKVQSITPSTKRVNTFVDVYVAMIETINNRLKKNNFSLKNIDLVIADECHILIFDKVYGYFPNANILGMTATPVVYKKIKYYKCRFCNTEHYTELQPECCGFEADEWSKPFAMSSIYDDIVIGADIDELIEYGQLVPEIPYNIKAPDLSNLKIDNKTGDFSTKSLDETYGSNDAVFNVLLNYKEICKGKRTIIFNSSSRTNLLVYEQFKKDGLNVKLFDSVNATDVSRKQLIEWFENNDDAILCNVGIFTTGFDSKEVQAIIINRATLSLSLYLQMVGRGGRSSTKIFKDSFIFIDGGDNIDRFGDWSAKGRDWYGIFKDGIGKPKAKKTDIEDVQDCEECGFYFPKRETKCPNCETVVNPKETRVQSDVELSESVAMPIRAIPPPNSKIIVEYTNRMNEDIHFAFKIMRNRILDMFIYYRVTKDKYLSSKKSGEFNMKIGKIVRQCYFYFIKQDCFKGDTNRTLQYVIDKTIEKIDKYYGCN